MILEIGRPAVIGHRGSRLLWPENTMAAFVGAASLGCRIFETDLHITADGVLVCFHDRTLERTTDGIGPVRSRTFEELRALDAGYRHQAGEGYPFRGTGLTVPALEEVLGSFPDTGLIIDLKEDGMEEPLGELLRRLGAGGRAVVGSFSDPRLQRFRSLTGGEVATSGGPKEILRLMAASRIGGLPEIAARALQIPVTWYGLPVVTPGLVDLAHRLGLPVHVWTVNRPAEAEVLAGLGVDGIITDRADLIAPVVRGGGQESARSPSGGF